MRAEKRRRAGQTKKKLEVCDGARRQRRRGAYRYSAALKPAMRFVIFGRRPSVRGKLNRSIRSCMSANLPLVSTCPAKMLVARSAAAAADAR